MNPVLAGMALVLVAVFAALAFSRRRREKQNWRLLAGLAAVFAVALAASLFIPPFEAAPPPLNGGQPPAAGPEDVVLEGVLKKQPEKCADGWCFSIDVLSVISGPVELKGRGLEIRTDKKVILFADKLVRVSGILQEDYVETVCTEVSLVDAQGNVSAAEFTEPEPPPEQPVGGMIELEGVISSDWERCGDRWCADFSVGMMVPTEMEIPPLVRISHSERILDPVIVRIIGTYKDGAVKVTYAGIVDVIQ